MDPAPVVTDPPKPRRQRRGALPDSFALTPAPSTTASETRLEVRKVDLWSVLKVSLCFYLAALGVLLVAGVVLWLLADASGTIGNVEKFMGKILSSKDYRLVSSQILEGTLLVGLVLVALMTILTVIGAALYNLFSELVGGFELTMVEAGRPE